MSRTKSIKTLASIYVGTVIGAGFASGQEILQFFAKHGKSGIAGLLLASILFCIIASQILKEIYKNKIISLEGFLMQYFSSKAIFFINIILIFLLLVGYFVMLAGSGAIFREYFNIAPIYGILLMTAACLLVFLFGINGIARANNFVVPLLFIAILGISIAILKKNEMIFSNWNYEKINIIQELKMFPYSFAWLFSALLYVAYNSIGVIVVFSAVYPIIYDEKAAEYGGIFGGLILGVLALLILSCILVLYTSIIGLEVPMIAIAHSLGEMPRAIYSGILILAMFTTAIANGYGCILRIANLIKIKENIASIIVCIISMPLALLGFKKLVSFFYPIFGYISVAFLAYAFIKGKR